MNDGGLIDPERATPYDYGIQTTPLRSQNTS